MFNWMPGKKPVVHNKLTYEDFLIKVLPNRFTDLGSQYASQFILGTVPTNELVNPNGIETLINSHRIKTHEAWLGTHRQSAPEFAEKQPTLGKSSLFTPKSATKAYEKEHEETEEFESKDRIKPS